MAVAVLARFYSSAIVTALVGIVHVRHESADRAL